MAGIGGVLSGHRVLGQSCQCEVGFIVATIVLEYYGPAFSLEINI